MLSFLQRHAAAVMGHLSGWDRLRFRGTLRMLANVTGLFKFLCYRGMLLKDFGDHAHAFSQQVRNASLAVAAQADRPIVHLRGPSVPKEDQARQQQEIARQQAAADQSRRSQQSTNDQKKVQDDNSRNGSRGRR